VILLCGGACKGRVVQLSGRGRAGASDVVVGGWRRTSARTAVTWSSRPAREPSGTMTGIDVWSVPVSGGPPTLVLADATLPDEPPRGSGIAFVEPGPGDPAGYAC